MSRIGNAPVIVPKDVSVVVESGIVVAKGPIGELTFVLPPGISLLQEGGKIMVQADLRVPRVRALQGLARAILANALFGVTKGWTKTLELVGVGYRAIMSGTNVQLAVGFSHSVSISPPPGVSLQVAEGKIVVSGADKQLVGETAATIRKVKRPEPYKGKGIRYQGEKVRKKAGKSAKAIGGAPGTK